VRETSSWILRSSPSASLVKISAISRPTDVPFNPLRPRVRRPAASRAPFSPPLRLSFSISLSFFPDVLSYPTSCHAVLCGRSDLSDTRARRRVEAEGEWVLSGGHPAAKGCPEGPGRPEQLFSGAMTLAAPRSQHARSSGNGNAKQCSTRPVGPRKNRRRANLNGARALTSQFTREWFILGSSLTRSFLFLSFSFLSLLLYI